MKKFILVIFTAVLFALSFVLYSNQEIENTTNDSKSDNIQGVEITPIPTSDPIINNEVKILFVGDVMLARSIGELIKKGQNPFQYVKNVFDQYDLVVINLETSISDKGSPQEGKLFTFRAPIESISILEQSGVDVVSLANNHTNDYGSEAFTDMLERLKSVGINQFGGGNNIDEAFQPLFIEINGIKINLIGLNDIETNYNSAKAELVGNAFFDNSKVTSLIAESKLTADYVIAFVHWGTEFTDKINQRQRLLTELMVNAGADFIVGAHPHVTQPTEVVNDIPVVYSLGNFVFDQMYLDAAKGNMLEIILNKEAIESYKLIPIKINSSGFPQLVE